MLTNYFKVALRNLLRNKTYSFIHIIGLTIGIASLVFILKYVQRELSYDRFHKHADQVYRMTLHSWAQTPAPLGPALREFFPEIIYSTRIKLSDRVLVSYDETRFYEDRVVFADPSIFDVFTFQLQDGHETSALTDPYAIVITPGAARKYFGTQDPIGKKLTYDDRIDFHVTGVLKDVPQNSHLKFDFICSLGSADKIFYHDFLENRINTVVYTYLRLRDGASITSVRARLDEFTRYYLGEDAYKRNKEDKSQWRTEFHLQPLAAIHLHSNLGGEFEPNGEISNVYLFSLVGGMILLIACINYMNLSTARYLTRFKEVGIRRVVGAERRHLVLQFIGESAVLALIATALALALVELTAPWIGLFLGYEMGFADDDVVFWLCLAVIALSTGVFSGIYPSIFLSRFRPVDVLSKTVLIGKPRFGVRNVLVTLQFVISIALIIAALIVDSQLSFVQNKDLGFDKEHIVVVPLEDNVIRQQYKSLKHQLLQHPGIRSATASSVIPGGVRWVRSFFWEGQNKKEDNTLSFIAADCDFLTTYGINVREGRNFSESFPADETYGYIVNEAALEKLGWQSPIGKRMGTMFKPEGSVIGLVRDFHFKSLHQKIEPLAVFMDPTAFGYLSIRMKSGDLSATLGFIAETWKAFSPHRPFQYFFLDEYFDKLYRAEQRMRNIFGAFSGLAILIACLGLFGLAAFSTETRAKEIGVRRVLGASVSGIVAILSKDLIKLVLLANVIAWPVAYYVMQGWLENFAYRISMSWGVFAIAGGLALLIAFLTVCTHAIKAALANPVEALRYE